MKQNLKHIDSTFKTPDKYFESFSKRLEDEFQAINFKKQVANETIFIVPERYFETFQNRLHIQVKPIAPRTFSLSVNKYWVSGIAAIFLLSIMLPIFFNAQELKQTNEAAKDYLEIHADELSTYEVGILLQDSEIEDLENELIYNNI